MLTYFGIVEGQLLVNAGKGISEYTIREVANIAYYLIAEKFPSPQSEAAPTIEEQIEMFDEQIGQRVSAAALAEKMMRENMIARGLDPDAKPELSPELRAKMEDDALREMSDKDLFFSDRAHSGKEFMGQKIKGGDDFE